MTVDEDATAQCTASARVQIGRRTAVGIGKRRGAASADRVVGCFIRFWKISRRQVKIWFMNSLLTLYRFIFSTLSVKFCNTIYFLFDHRVGVIMNNTRWWMLMRWRRRLGRRLKLNFPISARTVWRKIVMVEIGSRTVVRCVTLRYSTYSYFS